MSLEEQISAVLNDPEAMKKISAIAGSLGMGVPGDGAAQAAPQPAANGNFPDMRGDARARLLMAPKPFLSEKRASYVDGAVAMMSVLKLGSQNGSLGALLSSLGGAPGALGGRP